MKMGQFHGVSLETILIVIVTNLECDPPRDVDGGRDPEGGAPLLERVAGVEEESRGEGRENPSKVGHRVGDAHDDAGVQGREVQHAA